MGVPFIDQDQDLPLGAGARYPHSIYAGVAPLAGEHGLRWLAAPRNAALSRLLRHGRSGDLSAAGLAIATPSHLSRLMRTHAAADIARKASHGLANADAAFSARDGLSRAQRAWLAAAAAIAVALFGFSPAFASNAFALFANCLFFGAIVLRLFAGAASLGAASGPGRLQFEDRDLPAYSIVVALHKEARVVAQLATALEAIDYPRGKLDIKLVVEADDHATRLALEALRLPPIYEIIVAPDGAPRTKPRALNVALPLLRGEFTAVFDAEDAPAPLQLRHAAERFLRGSRQLACLQARLTIDNVEDSWLTRMFSIEYAALFDVHHPGLAALKLPLPLGGSSNHFRTDVLREVCGWDAWNVTEDADLGLRLARFGYRTGTLPLSTQEEAPSGVKAWLTQRRRWSKGWMQTLITLSRDPRRLVREIGLAKASGLGLMMVGLTIAPPLWPLLTAMTIYEVAAAGVPSPASGLAFVQAALWVSVATFGAGSVLWLSLLGMKRRRLLGLWPFLPLLVPYYLLMSVASWAALYDLVLRPFHWHKTEHGLAKSSRHNLETIAARAARARSRGRS